jgi:hypothetical protein
MIISADGANQNFWSFVVKNEFSSSSSSSVVLAWT